MERIGGEEKGGLSYNASMNAAYPKKSSASSADNVTALTGESSSF